MLKKHIDTILLIPVLILIGISLTTIFSLNLGYFRNQLVFFVLSIGLFFFFSQIDFSFLVSLSKPIYIVSLVSLLIILFLGTEAKGASRWLDVFGLRLQFSEIFKPFLAVALAHFLAERPKNFSTSLFLLLFSFPLLFLIYKQPDLGSALIYLFSILLTMISVGFPLWWFGALTLVVGASLPLLFTFLHGYQKARLLTFFHITNDPLGSSYNAIQALIAIGSGMLIGEGFGQGTQSILKFLPERHTDFIFATIAEDLGFLGSMVVVAMFAFFLYRLYHIIQETEEKSEKIFLIATFSLIFVQCVVNIGMNIGLLPIVGVPLPFVSYGGSSLLSSAIFLGIVASIWRRNIHKSTLEIR